VKILFDTNVFTAAFVAHGTCSEVFEHCLTEHTICASSWILEELREKLLDKLGFPQPNVDKVVKFIQENTRMIKEIKLNEPVCRDPDDDQILAAASGGNADCILSGDKDLLVIKEFQGIPILKPADFWQFEIKRSSQK